MKRDNLWAPWRMEYILARKGPECIFCTMPDEGQDRANLILHRGRLNYIIMNKFPYNSGHLMVVPYFHTSSFDGLTQEHLSEMMELVRLCMDCLQEAMRPEGFNTGLNIGTAAGAGIKEHLHMHIIPRWVGDSNFLPLMADVRSNPGHLYETYDRLLTVFTKHAA